LNILNNRQNSETAVSEFCDYDSSISSVLDELNFFDKLEKIKKIIIKPNLLEIAPPPCTTDVKCVEAIIKYIFRYKSNAEISVIEGSGGCDTKDAFKALGYLRLEKDYSIKLIDVDNCNLKKLHDKNAIAYKEILLPEVISDSFFISVPCLKEHSITTVTLGLKNLVGLLPKKYYGGYWNYNRSDVHRVGVNNAIVDLNNYVHTAMTVIDGRIGQNGSHLPGGRKCIPGKNIIIAGYDVLEVDKKGAEILGHNWQDVKHLKIFSQNF
jgi:uncharacterized protein (DUF362 family)